MSTRGRGPGSGARVLTIAHRGASRDAAENTLEAFRLAVAQGADMIETDLHLTRDGEIVLRHDAELDATEIGALTLAGLRERLPEVPTLEETLDAVGDRIPFNLELKRPRDETRSYAGLEERVLEEVRRRGDLERTLFSSFYDSVLARLRALEPAARLGLLVSRRAPVSIEQRASRVGAEAVHPDRAVTRPELIDRLHTHGYRVYVFTVDAEEDLRRLIGWGVDGIFTNVPARLRALLAQ